MITLAAGGAHTCGARSDGTVWCWGEGSSGQLGQGGSLPSQFPLADTQVQDFDFDPDSPLTRIWVDPIDNLTNADGMSTKTIHVQLTSQAGAPLAGVTPTFDATDTFGTNIKGTCSASSGAGESVCTLKSTYAEIKEVMLTSPLTLKAPATTAFKSLNPARLLIRGLNPFYANTCSPQPFTIYLADSNSNPKVSGTSWTFNLSASASPTIQAQFFADPFCTVPLGSNFQFDPGQSRLSFYIKTPPSNAAEVYVFGVSGSPYPLHGNPLLKVNGGL